jgi:transposase
MVAERKSMRNIREVLRLKFESQLKHRQIARSLSMALGTISLYLNRAKEADLQWPLPNDMDDNALERALFPNLLPSTQPGYVQPDYAVMHHELKHKGVTKQLLWEEYKQIHGDNGLQYSQYCYRYQQWAQHLKRSMRQIHKAGEKCFIDYCGPTIPVINASTGEVTQTNIFVAVLGASSYTYAEATKTQTKADWIQSHVNMFNFFGGVTEMLVPDNLRSAVTKADRYEPEINISYQHMATHYKTVVIPARPYKPKDKSKVEVAVQVVERWIIARLRHQEFFSLCDLNKAIRFLLDDLNQRPFKKLPGCRKSQFEALDKPALRALPVTAYYYTEFKLVRVNIDYHIEFDKHYYSVPHHLVKHQVEAQATYDGIALFFKGKQIARHARSYQKSGYTTDPNHMPQAHRKHSEWSSERLLNWGGRIGPDVRHLIQCMFDRKRHPEQAYRGCLGILNLSEQYDAQRLNQACAKAVSIGSPTAKSVKSILSNNLEKMEVKKDNHSLQENILLFDDHDNIRGPEYYH